MSALISFGFLSLMAVGLRREGMRRQAPCFAALVSALLALAAVGPLTAASAQAFGVSAGDGVARFAGWAILFLVAFLASLAWDERPGGRLEPARRDPG